MARKRRKRKATSAGAGSSESAPAQSLPKNAASPPESESFEASEPKRSGTSKAEASAVKQSAAASPAGQARAGKGEAGKQPAAASPAAGARAAEAANPDTTAKSDTTAKPTAEPKVAAVAVETETAAATQPSATAEPSVAEPSVAEPSVAEPSVAEPSTAEPSTAAPSVAGEPSSGDVEHRMLAMLEQVNQLLAAQQPAGANAPQTLTVPPAISEQLQLRAAELDRRDAAMQSRAQILHALEERLGRRDDDLRAREQEAARHSAELAARRREWAGRLRRHRQAAETRETLATQAARLGELVSGVAESFQNESVELRAVLLETVAAIQETGQQNQTIDPELQEQLEAGRAELETLREERERERQQREEVERELQQLREDQDQQLCHSLFSSVNDGGDSDGEASDVASLRSELAAAQRRNEELESQNSDLAGRVATSSVNDCTGQDGSESLDSLPWEERKRMILARLEDEESRFLSEVAADDPAAETTRDELQALRDMVHQTDREIMRRDAEIAELQQLLEQQSATVGDVAVGAAAIAGMFDQDELIREERENLQQLKSEWEEKLRNAEIEVSMERAKLARDRQALEKRNAELEESLAHQERASQHGPNDDEGKPVRRWLSRMGLSEE